MRATYVAPRATIGATRLAIGALVDACAESEDSDASSAGVSSLAESLAMLSFVEEALITQLWRMVLRFATSGHPCRGGATSTVRGSRWQGASGTSFTGPFVTGGDGFGEFLSEVFGVTARDEPAAVRIGIIGHFHPDGVRWSPWRQSCECGVGHLWVEPTAGSSHVITGENSDRAEDVKRHTCTADTQLAIVDDDRVGRGSRAYEDDSPTDGKNNNADTGAERRSVRDRHHSNEEECDNDPPHAGDHSLSVRLRHAVIFPAPWWTGSTVACHDRRVGFRLAPAGG